MKNEETLTTRKKVVLIGGLGTIGRILQEGLGNTYQLYVLDIREPSESNTTNYVKADVGEIEQLMTAIPDDTYALVNLSGLSLEHPIPDAAGILLANNVHIVGSYNVLLAAEAKCIGKVVFASTNHVTGAYETQGESSLGREIRTDDYPAPDSAYGAMKLCAELFGYLFSRRNNISVISLRLGSVEEDEISLVQSAERAKKTLLSREDTIEIFRRAIETKISHGVYYGVSDNPGKPWDLSTTVRELGFHPQVNSLQLLKKNE